MNKKMQKELSQMKYKYLLDTTTGLVGSKLHSCELCSKLSNYSSEVHNYFFVKKTKKIPSNNFFFQLTKNIYDSKKSITIILFVVSIFKKQNYTIGP